MTTDATTDNELTRALDTEVRSLRQQLAQREQALAVLNRRLLQLENGDNGLSGMDRAVGRNLGAAGERARADELAAELERLRNTKLFRWARPARTLYAVVRSPR